MSGKSYPTFPWSELIAWYEQNGRHHLPWRQYDNEQIADSNKQGGGSGKQVAKSSEQIVDSGKQQADSNKHGGGNSEQETEKEYLDAGCSMLDARLLYHVWLAEILLQQTQVDRVISYFERILERYPTIHDLARASYEEFFPYYQGMGYYSRARNILRTAKIVSEEYGGVFPRDKKLLQTLPGVGCYTSSAILAFGYGDPYLAWDTNLEKVFSRYIHGNRFQKLTDEEKGMVEEDFRKYISQKGRKQKIGETEGGKLSESDESQKHDDQSERAPLSKQSGDWKYPWGIFSPLGTFGTFSHESTETESIDSASSAEGRKIDSGSSPRMTNDEGRMTNIRAINNALMDFAATVDLKNPENIDWEIYPIHSGVWYATRGSLEPREEKKSITFPIPDATVMVILHQNHTVYYSEKIGDINYKMLSENCYRELGKNISYLISHISYFPFLLPPALHRDTRQHVQKYFREQYSLELSVRPVHAKWLSEDGHPYIAVNAQIQAGDDEQFSKHDKKSAQEVLKKIIP